MYIGQIEVKCEKCSKKHIMKNWVHIDSFEIDDRAMGSEISVIYEAHIECTCSNLLVVKADGVEYPAGSPIDDWDFEFENCIPV
ncbi:MAG: hypothetical protein INQ03_04760 [Candidatus Heimdallarchaeota archaeon]|nr:hypothetical protein [Candidatus Heimdallarchaeota archaeon]